MAYYPSVFVLAPGENWICDRFVQEWNSWYPNCANDPRNADIFWMLADWCDDHPSVGLALTNSSHRTKFVVSVHHIVPEKFDDKARAKFLCRDEYTNLYHVPCQKTYHQVRALTDKPIFVMPFWVNGEIWKKTSHSKQALRQAMGIDNDCFLVGSFQRDTEGHDLVSPKLEKGPDTFCDAVEILYKQKAKEGIILRVLLAGWRRQYVMNRLAAAGIEFYYAELPSNEAINNFYNALDLYIVASRYEGGPQAILECAATETPIISTDVGVASEILSPDAMFSRDLSDIFTRKTNEQLALQNVQQYLMPRGFVPFANMLKGVVS